MSVLTVGSADITDTWSTLSPNYLVVAKFTAVAGGTTNYYRLYASSSPGNVLLGIYSDVSGAPGTLLASQAGQSAGTASAYHDLVFPTFTVVSGTTYWLAAIGNTGMSLGKPNSAVGTTWYVANTYATGLPSTAPAVGSFTQNNNTAGWAFPGALYGTASAPATNPKFLLNFMR